jgi:hypothetical protein
MLSLWFWSPNSKPLCLKVFVWVLLVNKEETPPNKTYLLARSIPLPILSKSF